MPWPPGRRYCTRCKSLIGAGEERDWQTTGLCSYCAGQVDRAARMAAEDRNATEQSLVDRYHQATKMPWED
jgi:hypothetical protein